MLLPSVDSIYLFVGGITPLSAMFGLCAALCAWILYSHVYLPLSHPLRKHLPHKAFRPITGNFLEIYREETVEPFIRWCEEFKSGVFVYYGLMSSTRVCVSEPEWVRHICVTNAANYEKPLHMFRLFKEVVGDGLLTSSGQFHKRQRKLCNPAFRTTVIKNFSPTFAKFGDKLESQWYGRATALACDNVVEVTPDLMAMALDVIGEAFFSFDFSTLDHPDSPIVKSYQAIMGTFGVKLKNLIPIFRTLPTASRRQWQGHVRSVENVLENAIDEKIQSREISYSADETEFADLVSLLLEARDDVTGSGLTRKQLRDEAMTFMLAGHETSSVSLTWCLYCLASHPDVQTRLRQEVLALSEQELSVAATVDNLPYLNAVVKETLRLYPPAPNTLRESVQDDVICGVPIPKGTFININIAALHRNEAYWKNASQFDPDRFLDESAIQPFTFLPFLAGPRMCIGYRFALLEVKVVLATLLRRLQYAHVPGSRYRKRQGITMKPNPGLKLIVRPVEI